jgi:hypothetical protein
MAHTEKDSKDKHTNTGAAMEAEIDEIFGGQTSTEEDEDEDNETKR